ncbi:MAG: HNH endonuclease [Planctomycetaceae bacterium]
MSVTQAKFDTPHDEAFRRLGVLKPGQQWSAFDVPREQARKGKAKRFVTTLWNIHSRKDAKGRRTPTVLAISKDQIDGTFWYRFSKPEKGTKRKTWIAHWNGLQLALKNGIPIIGVLKDVYSKKCSLNHLFDCGNPRYEVNGNAMWLELRPRGDVGWEVQEINIRLNTKADAGPDAITKWRQHFDESVHVALQRTPAERKRRLANAAPIPRRITIMATIFDRNPDVVAYVLDRAKGICEQCRNPAPFLKRKDKKPYLEVHHRTPLADGGEDTIKNAVALCPNCHRAAHYE